MPISPGARLGSYEVLSLLGAGGMGEVYKARDTRLDRTVAIKVLPSHLADKPQLRERFEREARMVASLNHPHICTLYDIGQQDGIHFLVMEYLDGETLADRLAKGPLPLDQVLRYAIEISDALDKAHRQGVTHRDLKPGNIMLTKAGAKLLDFGLAKLRSETAPAVPFSQLPTAKDSLTIEGTILGTLQYMAPEQVEGKIDEIDARTDIFAFGVVVYEMATGKKAFEGKSATSVIAAILKDEPPPMSSLQPMTPPALDRVVKKCLAKRQEDRWQSAKDLHDELKWIKEGGSQANVGATPSAAGPRKLRERIAWAIAGVAVLTAVALSVPYFRSTPASTDSNAIRFFISATGLTTLQGSQLAVSPDGTSVVFVASDPAGQPVLWVRSLDSPEAHPLAGSEGAIGPFWSPDSTSIGFVAEGNLKIISASGGPAQTLASTAIARGATWNREGIILFTPNNIGGLDSVSDAGGVPTHVTTLNSAQGETGHRWAQFLPDGRHFLYWVQGTPSENNGVYVGSLDSEESKLLMRSKWMAKYSPSGYLLFMRDTTLMSQPFNVERLELTGEPALVAEGLWLNQTTGKAGFSVSETGVLVYWSGGNIGTLQLAWFDRGGNRLGNIGSPGQFVNPKLSPDGKRVAVDVDNRPIAYDIWLMEADGEASTRFTFDPSNDRMSLWSPDVDRIVFHSNRNEGIYDLYQKPASGAGNEELLFQSSDQKYPSDLSSDGRYLVYRSFGSQPGASADLWVLPLFGDREPFPFLATNVQETQAQFSPDGQWIAYVENELGRDEVYISSFPSGRGKFQISHSGGVSPRWGRDGKELFFISRDRNLMAVSINIEPNISVGTPRALFAVPFTPAGSDTRYMPYSYDVSADSQRFLLLVPPENSAVPITVVLNWTAGLEQ